MFCNQAYPNTAWIASQKDIEVRYFSGSFSTFGVFFSWARLPTSANDRFALPILRFVFRPRRESVCRLIKSLALFHVRQLKQIGRLMVNCYFDSIVDYWITFYLYIKVLDGEEKGKIPVFAAYFWALAHVKKLPLFACFQFAG